MISPILLPYFLTFLLSHFVDLAVPVLTAFPPQRNEAGHRDSSTDL